MKKIILLTLILSFSAFAGFFDNQAEAALKAKAENLRLCKLFTAKSLKYQTTMRNDRLAQITLDSYKKRANIFCTADEEEKKSIPENKKEEVKKEATKSVIKVKVVPHTTEKQIAQEDERLCQIFQNKITMYKKDMRNDELAKITLASYKKRASIFCSDKVLEKKEQEVKAEDTQLCELFTEGPSLCKIFNEKIVKYEKNMRDDHLAEVTLASYKKRANIFCSQKELKEKDTKVYVEHNRLCKIFNDKVIDYQKDMRDDRLAKVTLESYKKRATYFCSQPSEE